jgi:hypothetical protein
VKTVVSPPGRANLISRNLHGEVEVPETLQETLGELFLVSLRVVLMAEIRLSPDRAPKYEGKGARRYGTNA